MALLPTDCETRARAHPPGAPPVDDHVRASVSGALQALSHRTPPERPGADTPTIGCLVGLHHDRSWVGWVDLCGDAPRCLGAQGLPGLGGATLDSALVDWFCAQTDTLQWGRTDRDRLLECARRAREALSDQERVTLAYRSPQGSAGTVRVDREVLEGLAEPLWLRLARALRRSGGGILGPRGRPQSVYVVGGLAGMPMLRRRLRTELGCEPSRLETGHP